MILEINYQNGIKSFKINFAIGQKRAEDFKDFVESEGVFSSGDIKNDGETVVQAVAEGKEVALKMIEYMNAKEEK